MATSFSGGRSRSTQREPPTIGKQLVNFITLAIESCVYIYKCILSRVFLQGTIDIELEKHIENQTRLENKMGNMHQVM
jgi:hypothetical protein